MNTNNFKIFVEALEALPDEIKNNKVDMNSTLKPACGTPGCFGGLISIVANDIPELKNNYTFPSYSYAEWAYTLRDFLGVSLEVWASENPRIWENENGISVYSWNKAWGKKQDETLTHNDIIIHLRKAFDNWIAFENKSNEHQYPKTEQ
jgi:hypothetical protein